MAQEWYYTKDGDRQGPITPQQLKQLAASGELQPTDLIWKDGMAEWKPAKSLKGLFQVTRHPKATEPPPPPTGEPSKTPIAPFWENAAIIIPSLVCCFPLGLFFVWKTSWSNKKKWIYTGVCGAFVVFGSVSTQMNKQEAAKKTAEANALWEQGEQEKAIILYRELEKDSLSYIPEGQRPIVFGRLIDHEAKNGNTEEVRRLLEKAFLFKPDIRSDEGKQIVAQIEAEKEAEEAKARRKSQSGSKLAAFRKVVAKFKDIPPRFTVEEERLTYLEELSDLVQEYNNIDFDFEEQRDEVVKIILLYESELEGQYTGALYREVHNDVVQMRQVLE